MSDISVNLVTPMRSVSKDNVDYVRCPGLDGSFGIMKNHRDGIISIGVGKIRLDKNNKSEWFITSGGFAEIENNNVTILLETLEKPSEIDSKRVKLSIEKANRRKKDNSKNKYDLKRIDASLKRALNRLSS
tara:strand:- start:969 stop:1361 length:393 start_codon:yes stop_codon:yes gene_type:complete